MRSWLHIFLTPDQNLRFDLSRITQIIMSDYYTWTRQCHQNWSDITSIRCGPFDVHGITFVYLILASEGQTFTDGQFIVTCVLFQPKSGSYFECILRWSQAGEHGIRNHSIYRYMKSQMQRSLKVIFRFENCRNGRRMLQKNPSSVK